MKFSRKGVFGYMKDVYYGGFGFGLFWLCYIVGFEEVVGWFFLLCLILGI